MLNKTMKIMDEIRKIRAESATGCAAAKNKLRFYHRSQPDSPLNIDEAGGLCKNREWLEVPEAGAGSAYEIIRLLLDAEASDWETSSSAGDWTFRVSGLVGAFVTQENRYPRFGFSYQLFYDYKQWHNS